MQINATIVICQSAPTSQDILAIMKFGWNLCGGVSGGHEMDPSFAFARQTRSHILHLVMMQNGIFWMHTI